jgi:hypothetical protein
VNPDSTGEVALARTAFRYAPEEGRDPAAGGALQRQLFYCRHRVANGPAAGVIRGPFRILGAGKQRTPFVRILERVMDMSSRPITSHPTRCYLAANVHAPHNPVVSMKQCHHTLAQLLMVRGRLMRIDLPTMSLKQTKWTLRSRLRAKASDSSRIISDGCRRAAG